MKIVSFSLAALLLIALSGHAQDINTLPINKIQVIGSHNSYKEAIDPALFKFFQGRDSVSASKIDYEHIGLAEQLDMGLRNLEVDVYADEKGGKYAHPKGLDWAAGQASFDPEGQMRQPGFKVFHIVDLDFRSHALTLTNLLQQLRTWSEAHPDHEPVFITLEGKDGASDNEMLTVAEKFMEQTLAQLDTVLLNHLGKEHIITPDEVRGKYKTLNEAVLRGNWPTLKQAKGKFLFILDDKSTKRDMYIAGHPSLKGRVMFANAEPGKPEAAMMILNDPKNPQIPTLVKQGYIIRTRADSDTKQARLNDKSDFEAACRSGAQIITTDYYQKSTHFSSDYSVSFDGSKYVRINPVFVSK
jgi:hypothetical protein